MNKKFMSLPVIGVVVAMLGASVFAASPSAGTHPISVDDPSGYLTVDNIIIIDGEDLKTVKGMKATELGISKDDLQAEVDKVDSKIDAADLEVVHTFGAYYAPDYEANGEHIEWHYINPQPFTFRVSFNSDSSDAVIVLHFDSNLDQWVIVGTADSTSSVSATVSNLSPFAIVKASPASSSQTGEYAGAYIVMVAAALAACGAVFAIRAKKATR